MSGVSLSFKGSGRPAKKVKVQFDAEEQQKELIVGISSGGIQSKEPKAPREGPRVIPGLSNTFQAGRGKVGPAAPGARAPTFLPTAEAPASNSERFEKAAEDAPQARTYGLVMAAPQEAPSAPNGSTGAAPPPPAAGARPSKDQDTAQFRDEVETLPEEPDDEAFDSMPVDAFGDAMLRGMGWNPKADKRKPPVEYVARPHRLGLGAAPPAAPSTSDADRKPALKPGETPRPVRGEMVLPPDADGRQRNVRGIDELLVHRDTLNSGPQPGRVMHVTRGRHSGLECTVLELLPVEPDRSARAQVRLQNEETVSVRCADLSEGPPPAAPREPHRSGERRPSEIRESGSGRGRDEGGPASKRGATDDRGGGGDRAQDARRREGSRGAGGSGRSDRLPAAGRPWLVPHIRVRIVDKLLKGGGLYLKKAVVLDVAQPGVGDLRVDGRTAVLEGVSQDCLETVVPRAEGAAVMVLRGDHKGAAGRLKQRKKDAVAVQLEDDGSVVLLMADDVAELATHKEEW